jgi:hypothetical protein
MPSSVAHDHRPEREFGVVLFMEIAVRVAGAVAAVAHAAEIRRDDAVVLCQPRRDEIPPVGMRKVPVQQQQHGRAGRARPLQVMHADAGHIDVVRAAGPGGGAGNEVVETFQQGVGQVEPSV